MAKMRHHSFSPCYAPKEDDELLHQRHVSRLDRVLHQALGLLREKDAENTRWKLLENHKWSRNTVRVYRLEESNENHVLGVLHGEGVYEGFDSNQFLAVLRNAEFRKKWDTRFESSNIIAKLDENSALVHFLSKATMITSGRDLCAATRIGVLDDGTKFLLATSVEDERVPLVKGITRAHTDFSLWTLRDLPNEDATMVTFTAKSDPRGTIPVAMLRIVSSQIPRCVQDVYKLLNQGNGAPFFVNPLTQLQDHIANLSAPSCWENFARTSLLHSSYSQDLSTLRASFSIVLQHGHSELISQTPQAQAVAGVKPAIIVFDPFFCGSGASVSVSLAASKSASIANHDDALLAFDFSAGWMPKSLARSKLLYLCIAPKSQLAQHHENSSIGSFELVASKITSGGVFHLEANGSSIEIPPWA